jgi:hypothetical protein
MLARLTWASQDAAKVRVSRALEKLRRIFGKRGIALTAAAIAGAVSVNSVQAAPAGLAGTISAMAAAKGAAAGTSTLTLIKGALKIMAWTKAKTAVVIGAGVLLATGTTTVAVKEIEEHRSYPWQINEGGITGEQLALVAKERPEALIVRSKFHKPAEADQNGIALGTGVRAKDVVAWA